jgi:hypothetical protein
MKVPSNKEKQSARRSCRRVSLQNMKSLSMDANEFTSSKPMFMSASKSLMFALAAYKLHLRSIANSNLQLCRTSPKNGVGASDALRDSIQKACRYVGASPLHLSFKIMVTCPSSYTFRFSAYLDWDWLLQQRVGSCESHQEAGYVFYSEWSLVSLRVRSSRIQSPKARNHFSRDPDAENQ